MFQSLSTHTTVVPIGYTLLLRCMVGFYHLGLYTSDVVGTLTQLPNEAFLRIDSYP